MGNPVILSGAYITHYTSNLSTYLSTPGNREAVAFTCYSDLCPEEANPFIQTTTVSQFIWLITLAANLKRSVQLPENKRQQYTRDPFELHAWLRDVSTWATLRAGAGVIVGRGWSWRLSLVVVIRRLG